MPFNIYTGRFLPLCFFTSLCKRCNFCAKFRLGMLSQTQQKNVKNLVENGKMRIVNLVENGISALKNLVGNVGKFILRQNQRLYRPN